MFSWFQIGSTSPIDGDILKKKNLLIVVLCRGLLWNVSIILRFYFFVFCHGPESIDIQRVLYTLPDMKNLSLTISCCLVSYSEHHFLRGSITLLPVIQLMYSKHHQQGA